MEAQQLLVNIFSPRCQTLTYRQLPLCCQLPPLLSYPITLCLNIHQYPIATLEPLHVTNAALSASGRETLDTKLTQRRVVWGLQDWKGI